MLHLLIAGAMAMAVPQQMDTTFAVQPDGRLAVDTYAGSVDVRSWDRNEVRVQATYNSRSDIDIDHLGSTVAIDASADNGMADVRFIIHVPRSFRIIVDGVRTDAIVDGVRGDVVIETVGGSITVRNVIGRVTVESVSGWVKVEDVRGRVSASSTNQAVRLARINGDVMAETVNGSITMLALDATNVAAETVNGSITIGSTIRDGGSYTASTTNGSITMAIPDDANASFRTSTFSGSVVSSMNLTLDRRRSGEQSFRIGSGSARITLESFQGTIRLVTPAELNDAKNGQKNK